jgi:response regulator RpfG family c-di-GMP phosphodiesterase
MSFCGATVLILEDEPIIALALEDVLVAEGASVRHASRIAEARELLLAENVDSAILDVNLHGTLSYPVAELLAERRIPFIFATGYGDRAHPQQFAEVPTIAKPYSVEDLRKAFSQLTAST